MRIPLKKRRGVTTNHTNHTKEEPFGVRRLDAAFGFFPKQAQSGVEPPHSK
jgi:hypothetical protein